MVHVDGKSEEGVVVGFSKLETNDKDMRFHHDSTNNILGVSCDDSMRWRKKTMKARIVIGLMTIIITALITILILTLELQLHCHGNANSTRKDYLKDSVKFLLISDYHFDNNYDENVNNKPTYCRKLGNYVNAPYKAPLGRVGCDSPGVLVDNVLDAAKEHDGVSFALMTGDFSAHRMDASYFDNETSPAERTLQNILISASKTRNALSKIPIFPAFGNNDLPGHYILPVNDDWYNKTLASFAPLIMCDGCPDSVPKPTDMKTLQKTFLDGGYYSVNIPGSNGRMILLVLNTLYWNLKAVQLSHGNPLVQEVARKQMTWLETQLEQAKGKGQKVFISSHICPGIDPYDGSDFWLSNYTEMYVNLVTVNYRDIVAGQFYAHIHKDDFRLQVLDSQASNSAESLSSTANKSFALLLASVSPVYHNNPAYRVAYINAEKQALLDYDQFYLNLVMATEYNSTKWQLAYRFSDRYPSSNPYIDADRIYKLNQGLINKTSDETWTSYVFARTLFYQPGSYSRFALYCAMRYVFNDDYKKCIQEFNVPGG